MTTIFILSAAAVAENRVGIEVMKLSLGVRKSILEYFKRFWSGMELECRGYSKQQEHSVLNEVIVSVPLLK